MSFRPEKAFYPIGRAIRDGAVRIWNSLRQLAFAKNKDALAEVGHAYVDIFVETWRASAYLAGHVITIAIPFLIIVYSLY